MLVGREWGKVSKLKKSCVVRVGDWVWFKYFFKYTCTHVTRLLHGLLRAKKKKIKIQGGSLNKISKKFDLYIVKFGG